MRLLLDTHVLLGFLEGQGRSAARRSELILDPANDVRVSVVSWWEVAVKVRVGKLRVDLAELEGMAAGAGLHELPLARTHLRALAILPFHPDHRDPFDHLLIAQAVAEGLVFVTSDRHAARYPVRLLR